MAAIGSEVNSIFHLKPKPKTVVNGRCQFEDFGMAVPNTFDFSRGTPPFATMAKLRPMLAEATRLRILRLRLQRCKLNVK